MVIIVNSFFSFFFPGFRVEFLLISAFFFLKEMYHPFVKMGSFQNIFFFNDSVSSFLILLSCWISLLMIFSLKNTKSESMTENCILMLLMILCFFFFTTSKLWFFIFFEMSLFPIFYMMLRWGYQSERLKAVSYFMVYTVFFSMPFLISLMNINSEVFFLKPLFLEENNTWNDVWTFFLLLVLMIKMPLFFTHFWLPKAHVEAPVVGSMILAGILLKMGGFGILRLYNFISFSSKTLKMFTAISLLGAAFISVVCLFCSDLKQLIAYSSVSHMNLIVFSMMEGSSDSVSAALMLMVVHGVSSSNMFLFLDLIYKRSSSRSFFLNKGVLNLIPLSAFWLFMSVMSNTAVPPTMGSFSEILIFFSIFFKIKNTFLLMIFFVLFSAFYMIYFYYSLVHGNYKKNFIFYNFSLKENMIIFLHIMIVFFLTFLCEFFLL